MIMRKFLIYLVFFIETFVKRHLKPLGFSLLIGFFATLFLLQVYPFLSALLVRKHERIGYIGTFSPSNLPPVISSKISYGLTSVKPDGIPTEGAARSWNVVNNLKYTFYLKPNLKWHDGKQLTATDINYKIKDAKITATDNYTLTIELKEPYAPLPVLLSTPLLREKLTGLGAYKVIRMVKENDNKITELTLLPYDRKLPTQTYKFYSIKSDALLAFKLGEVDILEDIDVNGDFTGWKNIIPEERTQYNKVVALFFNFNDPKLKEKEIRQALAYALPPFENRDKAVSPISPLSWAFSQKVRLYQYDTESALKILSQSPLASESAELILTAPPSLLQSAQNISNAWKKVGLNAKVRIESVLPSNYQVMLRSLTVPADPDQYVYWQSTQENTNISNYSSPKIDKLLEDGRKTLDTDARKKIYADFQFYLVDDAPAIFLYYPKVVTIRRK